MMNRETIAQIVTASGRAAVTILRVSGDKAKDVVRQLCLSAETILSKPRSLHLSGIYPLGSITEDRLDTALIAFFPEPGSFTGEDSVEFNLHGSPYIVSRMLEILQSLGVRLARPGEFTERAFLNGKLDLSQAEAVADVIAAETELQLRVANEQLSGRLSNAVLELAEPLRDLLAEIEAHIDFPDEDISPLAVSEWQGALSATVEKLNKYINSYQTGRIYRDGALVVLAGVPNAGKSSLLNQLLGEQRAIVTAIPGTTRDSIEEVADISGIAVRFCDTAGLAVDNCSRVLDEVELLGVQRSWAKIDAADLVLYIFDINEGLSKQEILFQQILKRAKRVLLVANKIDISFVSCDSYRDYPVKPLPVSALNGSGLLELQDKIKQEFLSGEVTRGSVLVTNQRHFEALKQAKIGLSRAILNMETQIVAELVALDIRDALGALNDIVGVTHTEDILGRIFSKFCIGK